MGNMLNRYEGLKDFTVKQARICWDGSSHESMHSYCSCYNASAGEL